jgi:hypothetical protein
MLTEELADNNAAGVRIPYLVKDAEFGGKGLFATAKVLKGTLVWSFKPGANVVQVRTPSLKDFRFV